MSALATNTFAEQYLSTWTAPDSQRRREAIDRVWSSAGRLVIAPMNLTISGADAIAAHVDRVHADNIVGRGLTFVYDQTSEAGDCLLLRWSMLAADGAIAGRGVDVVFRDDAGRATTIYMHMGIA